MQIMIIWNCLHFSMHIWYVETCTFAYKILYILQPPEEIPDSPEDTPILEEEDIINDDILCTR